MALDLREAAAIARGEIRVLLRDRHTLVYSILIPFLLYPGLFIGVGQAVVIAQGARERRISRVEVLGREAAPGLFRSEAEGEKLRWSPTGPAGKEPDPEKVRERIREGASDALLVLGKEPDGALRAEIFSNDSSDASRTARERVAAALEEHRWGILREKAEALGEDESFLDSLAVRTTDLSPVKRRLQEALGRIVPLLLVLMTAIGAFYPALDVTVGERERSTLETTLLAPVGRGSLVLGKFIPVAGLGLLSTALNFAGMALAAWVFLLQFKVGFRPELPSPAALAAIAGGTLLLALLLGAAMLAVSLLARSFKEGQSYLGTILLLVMVPGLAAAAPEVSLNVPLALVPVMNLALVVRDAFRERLDPALGALAFGAAAAFAALAIFIASRLAGREEVLLGSPAAVEGRRGLLARLLGKKPEEPK